MRPAAVDEQKPIEKIRTLPPEKAADVEDFADFLRGRQQDREFTQAARASNRLPPSGNTAILTATPLEESNVSRRDG